MASIVHHSEHHVPYFYCPAEGSNKILFVGDDTFVSSRYCFLFRPIVVTRPHISSRLRVVCYNVCCGGSATYSAPQRSSNKKKHLVDPQECASARGHTSSVGGLRAAEQDEEEADEENA